MPKKQEISKEQMAELEAARKRNKDKNVDRRLKALLMRGKGHSNAKTGEACGYNSYHVSKLVGIYIKEGLGGVTENHYKGNRRNMSFEEEAEFLAGFSAAAEQGQLVEVSTLEAAYEEKVGHSIGSGQIYRVLARHGWRKVMPRSKHPNKASDEVIEASKKLTQPCKKDARLSTKIQQAGCVSCFKTRPDLDG